MASGTTGTLLNEAESRVAREKAQTVKGAKRYEDCVKGAGADERMKRWVAEIDSREAARLRSCEAHGRGDTCVALRDCLRG